MPLQVGIVGAGIAGLSAAIALRRAGANVEIFEKSEFKNEIGAAITITPNGMRVLDSWGFDVHAARGVEAKQMRMVEPHSLETLILESFRDVKSEYGHNFMFFHRVDLHQTLRCLAESKQPTGTWGPAATIHLGKPAVAVDCEKGKIDFEDGTSVIKDLVVIADGIKSPFLSSITGQEEPTKETGWSAYRCLIPLDEIHHNENLKHLWEGQEPGFWVPFDLSTNFYLVAYECRDGNALNVALRHETLGKDEAKDDWNAAANIEDVLTVVKGFSPLLTELMKRTTDVSVHKLRRREPLDRYTRGKAVIIGDAAHPILPTHAQGAVLALEEAVVLEELFKDIHDPKEVQVQLESYQRVMKRRIHATQLLSDATPGIPGELRQRAEEVWSGEDSKLFPFEAMNFTKPVRDFFYSWDARAETRRS